MTLFQRISFRDINRVICHKLTSFLQPALPADTSLPASASTRQLGKHNFKAATARKAKHEQKIKRHKRLKKNAYFNETMQNMHAFSVKRPFSSDKQTDDAPKNENRNEI